ncbi:MAG TPA: tetratricopeptide repeat protein [Ignavibacteriales bacterium]|nr:tetratricopeptide repeat protein [Ignavibacteriales bacterium]
MQYCPNCGYDIKDKDYKFCPSCGANVQGLEEKSGAAAENVVEEIICDVCGMQSEGGDYCSECGAKFTGKEKRIGKSVPVKKEEKKAAVYKESKPVKKEAPKPQSGNKKKFIKEAEPEKKSFTTVQIAILVGVLFCAGLLILLAAGVFDSHEPKQAEQHQHTEGGANSGVDLNSLNKINQLESAVNANPSDKESLLQLAHLLNDSGFYERAVNRYNQYLKIVPNVPDVLVDLGVCYYSLGKYAEAKTEMMKAIKINPKHQIGHFNLGIVALASGNNTEAVDWFNKAVKINPNSDIAKRAKEQIENNK